MPVLFVSQLPLGRCENLTAVWDAYDGEKEFRLGADGMRSAERDGFSVVVCDHLPAYIEGKDRCVSINIGHGIEGGKLYGADEKWKPWFDAEAAAQTDFAIASSQHSTHIIASHFGIPEARVLPLGFPRTDAYFREGEVFDQCFGRKFKRMFLYIPTFRYDDGWLPRINWAKIDDLLADDEVMAVKRHYFTEEELTRGYDLQHRRVIEVPMDDPASKYLRSCDVVVTDYSSVIFDAYIMGTPVILTVDDKDVFLEKRGMYHEFPDFYSSLWLRAEGNEEALIAMMRDAYELNERALECLDRSAGACDGHAAERVANLIRSVA